MNEEPRKEVKYSSVFTEGKIYQGNKIPIFIKISWIVIILWSLIYLASYALPDLMQWLQK